MDGGPERKKDVAGATLEGGRGGAMRGKRLDKGRRVTIETCNGPVVIDLPTEGKITYVPFVVPAGVVVRFEDIAAEK